MNNAQRPSFGKGVRLRHEEDGTAMLLVPEGALLLNPPAAAALALVDGARTVEEIVAQLVRAYDVTQEQAHADVGALFERLEERRLIVTS